MPNTAFVLNGQVGLLNPRQMLAGAGKYFVATNPTPGTGVLFGTVTAFSATADGLFTISNNNPTGSDVNIYLDYLTLNMSGTAPTATTVLKMAVFNEVGIVAPSAGNVAITPRNVKVGGANSNAVINGFSSAAMTIPAAVGSRTLVSNISIPTSLGITGDSYVVQFGGDPSATAPLTAVRATAASRIVVAASPVTIAPQTTAIIDAWWLTQATNGPTFEFEIGYAEL
jgi:hypothetical protein